jgi:hypothetical protein
MCNYFPSSISLKKQDLFLRLHHLLADGMIMALASVKNKIMPEWK